VYFRTAVKHKAHKVHFKQSKGRAIAQSRLLIRLMLNARYMTRPGECGYMHRRQVKHETELAYIGRAPFKSRPRGASGRPPSLRMRCTPMICLLCRPRGASTKFSPEPESLSPMLPPVDLKKPP
jgi:hypothetical protein